jgi:4,5-dihydroxyphthalate decarboxylase
MANIQLSLGIGDYYHVRPLMDGTVRAEGIDLIHVATGTEEIFWRFGKYREWDVSEMSFANYSAQRSRDDSVMVAIPVFPSRVFRHSGIYVRKSSRIARPKDLAGKKVGVPEWAQTAGVYVRGQLAHQEGLRLEEVEWIQSGVNEPGREEKFTYNFPPGWRLTPRRDRSLNDMLIDGEIDAIITARTPLGFDQGHPEVVRLWPDYDKVEEEYGLATRIFPIMHLIAIRGEVYRKYPWVAMNLYKAFDAAKKIAIERFSQFTISWLPLAWLPRAYERTQRLFKGHEYWPYGIEPNRVTIEAFQQYLFEQSITTRRLTPEDLFAKETQSFARV